MTDTTSLITPTLMLLAMSIPPLYIIYLLMFFIYSSIIYLRIPNQFKALYKGNLLWFILLIIIVFSSSIKIDTMPSIGPISFATAIGLLYHKLMPTALLNLYIAKGKQIKYQILHIKIISAILIFISLISSQLLNYQSADPLASSFLLTIKLSSLVVMMIAITFYSIKLYKCKRELSIDK